MALFADLDDSYTKTGKGTLTRWSNFMSYIPAIFTPLKNVPFIGGTITGLLGLVDTIIESATWLFRGQIGSAATVLAAGAVGTAVNTLTDTTTWWVGNALSGVTTGATLGTHARALTESVIGGVTGALGAKPQVLASYPAGIGSIGTGMAPQGPRKFFSDAARSRGEDPNAAYARMQSGQADHIAALEAARSQQTGAYQGM